MASHFTMGVLLNVGLAIIPVIGLNLASDETHMNAEGTTHVDCSDDSKKDERIVLKELSELVNWAWEPMNSRRELPVGAPVKITSGITCGRPSDSRDRYAQQGMCDGTQGFVSRSALPGDYEDWTHRIDAYTTSDVLTFSVGQAPEVLTCFSIDNQDPTKLVLRSPRKFFSMTKFSNPFQEQDKIHLVVVDGFPIVNPDLVQRFVNHHGQVDLARSFQHSLFNFPQSADIREQKRTFQLQVGKYIGTTDVKRLHFEAIEFQNIKENILLGLRMFHPNDMGWQMFLTDTMEKHMSLGQAPEATENKKRQRKASGNFLKSFTLGFKTIGSVFHRAPSAHPQPIITKDVIEVMIEKYPQDEVKSALSDLDKMYKQRRSRKNWKENKIENTRTVQKDEFPYLFKMPEAVELMQELGFEDRDNFMYFVKGDAGHLSFLTCQTIIETYVQRVTGNQDESLSSQTSSSVSCGVTEAEFEMYRSNQSIEAMRGAVTILKSYQHNIHILFH